MKGSGFGQIERYVSAVAVVTNLTDKVGQTVTVNFNAFDVQGNLLQSATQVEAFSQPRADHALVAHLEMQPDEKVARVETRLDVRDAGGFSSQPFPQLPTANLKVVDKHGYKNATFELSNPMSEALKAPRLAIVCMDETQRIVGGGVAFPDLVPTSGKVKVDTPVNVTGEPASCAVYTGAPSDWQGPKSTATGAPEDLSPGSAAAAFRTWVEQFDRQEWSAQYQNLVAAQQALISEADYVACRKANPAPGTKWVALISSDDAGNDTIPGTSTELPATLLKVQVEVGGTRIPLDAHMYQEGGQWKWSMTTQNLDNCKG